MCEKEKYGKFGKIIEYLKNIIMSDKEMDKEDEKLKLFIVNYEKAIDDLYTNDFKIWRTPDELIGVTGTTMTQLTNVIENSNEFLKNSKGEITYKKKYKKKEKFIKKVNDTLNGYIE